MRAHYFSRVIIRFFMNVAAEDNADQDRLSNDYEETKNNEVVDTDTNPCVRRKQRK